MPIYLTLMGSLLIYIGFVIGVWFYRYDFGKGLARILDLIIYLLSK